MNKEDKRKKPQQDLKKKKKPLFFYRNIQISCFSLCHIHFVTLYVFTISSLVSSFLVCNYKQHSFIILFDSVKSVLVIFYSFATLIHLPLYVTGIPSFIYCVPINIDVYLCLCFSFKSVE
jgi:hypothetical protein